MRIIERGPYTFSEAIFKILAMFGIFKAFSTAFNMIHQYVFEKRLRESIKEEAKYLREKPSVNGPNKKKNS